LVDVYAVLINPGCGGIAMAQGLKLLGKGTAYPDLDPVKGHCVSLSGFKYVDPPLVIRSPELHIGLEALSHDSVGDNQQ
jgi:hypothetical protein